jgi:hypothetical protein
VAQSSPCLRLKGHFSSPVTAASPWTIGGFYDDPKFKPGYSNQWDLELQQQIGARSMFSIAYVGSPNGNLDYTGYATAGPLASANTVARATVINTAASRGWSLISAGLQHRTFQLQRARDALHRPTLRGPAHYPVLYVG